VTVIATHAGCIEAGVVALAAAIEGRSEHPLARALVAAAGSAPRPTVDEVRQVTGCGIAARLTGGEIRIGRPDFVAALSGAMPAAFAAFARERTDTLVGLGDAHRWLALFALADVLRPGARPLLDALRALGVTAVLLSGDRRESVDAVAGALAIRDARAALLPEDKKDAIAALQREGAIVAMVGDGVNDAPALAQAQVSVSLGSAAPLAQWTADIVVLSDRVELVAATLHDARRTFAIIRQNLAWATVYNAVAIPAAALGLVSPLVAAVGMACSSVVVVGNALRLARAPLRRAAAPHCEPVTREEAWKS
jgi:P-type Cu2+ transporter